MITSFMFVGCKEPAPEPSNPNNEGTNNGGTNNDGTNNGGNQTETTYTVKFYYEDESSAGSDVTGKKVGDEVNLPSLAAKEGKTFSGWYLTKTAEGTSVSSSLTGGKYTVKAADATEKIIKLYAVYIENSSAIEVESIIVSPSTVSNLQVGNTLQLTVSYNPVDANVGNSVTYVSDATNVATVDANGLVKAITAGNAVITVTSGNGKTATVNVTVVPKPKVLVDVILGKTDDTTFTATAKFDDSTTLDVTDEANWISTDTSVATVSLGNVEILEAGTTKISASYTYEGAEQTSAEATIVVEENVASSGEIDKLYFITTNQWSDASPRYAAYFFGNGEKWVDMKEHSTGVYVCDKPEGYPSVIFCRMNPSSTTNDWNSKWNQTDDLTIPTDKDTYKYDEGQWDKGPGQWLSTLTGNYGSSDGTFNVTVTMPEFSDDNNDDNNNDPVIPDDPVIPNGLYIYVKAASAPTIWAWEANSGEALSSNLGETWPGNAMSAAIGMNDPTGWYMKDFTEAGATGKNIVFKLNGGSSEITGLNKTFWYDGTQCYDTDPTTPPEPTAPSVTVSPSNGATLGLNDSITVSFNAGNDISNFEASITIAETTYTYGTDFNSLSKSFNVSSDLGIDSSTTVSVFVECSNSIGSDNFDGSYTIDETKKTDTFTWDNVNAYFVLTDRFDNGVSSNDHSYSRKNGLSGDENVATFHGGDIKGLTQNMDYFKKLGINAIWITAPYEQAHGWVSGKDKKFPHYAFHGYYTLDWTFMDQNMGTIDEFREFVQTCHANGIRVIMDVVMNHVGYNNTQDMVTYGHGKTSHGDGWLEKVGGVWDANDTVVWDHNLWETWWGPWARSFAYESGSEYGGSCGGLPDIKSEIADTNIGIAPVLKIKWEKENNASYDKWRVPAVANVDWWGKSGDWRKNQTARIVEYQAIWLSSWVREFGVDGFRCDTAKHVEPQYWGMLKDACTDALKKWRADPSKVDNSGAKDWDEEFWMTGECWGWTSTDGGGEYYQTGKFDSMINFSFNGGNNWNGTYRTSYPQSSSWDSYVNINNNADSDGNGNRDNVLSYISSHDTGLTRVGDQYEVGTGLVLLPGGVQIFYGDESYREKAYAGCGDGDMMTRGDMNLDEAKTSELTAHWGKVGNFRKYNPAVGAGTGSGTKRSYNGPAGESKIAIGINGTSVDVSGLFANGTTVYNWYDGKSATVSGGKVTFNGGTMKQPILVSDKNPADYGVTF